MTKLQAVARRMARRRRYRDIMMTAGRVDDDSSLPFSRRSFVHSHLSDDPASSSLGAMGAIGVRCSSSSPPQKKAASARAESRAEQVKNDAMSP